MAEVNFGSKQEAPAQQEETKQPVTGNATPAPTTTTALARPSSQELGDYIPTADQIILPRINIVQGVGKLKDSFPQGAIVLNQQTMLFKHAIKNAAGEVLEPGSQPLTITCCGFKPVRYVEQVAGGARGLIVNTEEEVAKAGGTLDYQTWVADKANVKRFSPYVEGMFLLEKPKDLESESFNYVVDGRKHAIILWAMKGTAYTAAAKGTFFTERAVGCLQSNGYPSMVFSLTTTYKKWGDNGAWVPTLLPTAKSSEERIAFCKSFLGAAATVAAEEDDDA